MPQCLLPPEPHRRVEVCASSCAVAYVTAGDFVGRDVRNFKLRLVSVELGHSCALSGFDVNHMISMSHCSSPLEDVYKRMPAEMGVL